MSVVNKPVFVDQSYLAIELDTKRDLTGATVTQILYKKPNGERGEWEASVSGTELHYAVQNDDLDVRGTWEFQTYVVIGDRKGYGEIFRKEIYPNIQ